MTSREIIAYCGIVCSACPAYIGTQTGDQDLLKRTAEKWARELGLPITPEGIVCDGCPPDTGTRHNEWCGECPIRSCAVGRKYENCAHCDEYPCEALSRFVAGIPEARSKLDEMRASLKG